MSPVILEAHDVSKNFPLKRGKVIEVLRHISLKAKDGEFISLIGPSGCGKTTLMKLLAGLIAPTSGEIVEHKHLIPDGRQQHGVMFQQYNLFPWLSVEENIEFGLKILHRAEVERKKIVAQYIHRMGLDGFERSYPKQLSGGMQQRVALARTFATNPKILFMDEPFAALDAQTKRSMQELLLHMWNAEPRTVIFVTHDVEEAIFLSDTIYVMSARPGHIRERVEVPISRPRDLSMEFGVEFLKTKKDIQTFVSQEIK